MAVKSPDLYRQGRSAPRTDSAAFLSSSEWAWQQHGKQLAAFDELPDDQQLKYSKEKTKTAWLNAKVRQLITLQASDKPGYMRHCHSCPVWTKQSASSMLVTRLAKYWFDRWKAAGHCRDNHVGRSGRKRAATLTQQEQDQCAQALAQNNPQLRALKNW
jgi:hypothetical protein